MKTIFGVEVAEVGSGGGLFWATSLEKIIGGVTACYPFGRKHGRYRAVKRRELFTLLIGGTASDRTLSAN